MPAAQRIVELIQAYADVIHVVDTDLSAAGRMRYVSAQSGSTLVGMGVERRAQFLAYPAQRVAEAVGLLRAARASTAALLRRFPD